jgi:hypothetical protein
MEKRLDLRKKSAWWLGILVVICGVLLFLLARKHHRPSAASRETQTTGAEMERDLDAPVTGAAGATCTSHVGCAVEDLCIRGHCAAITPQSTECRSANFRFARTTAQLSAVAEMTVERAARCIKAGRSPTLSYEESRDPLATTEDNDALSRARRANVQSALEKRGVPTENLDKLEPRK